MIVFNDFKGRIGNILFQLASTIGIANKNNCEYNFNDDIVRNTIFYNSFINIINSFEHQIPIDNNKKNINNINIQGYNDFCYKEIILNNQIDYTLYGYMQSELFFKHCKDYIYYIFTPKQEIINYLNEKYKDILNKNTCSIHIRLTDYTDNNVKNILGLLDENYYNKVIKNFDSDTLFLIFSDDIRSAKNMNLNIKNVIYIEGNINEIYDLYLMSMCKHNIIANSTFSWWGAWLNKNLDKKVYSPYPWFFGKNSTINTKDVIPEIWNKINVI